MEIPKARRGRNQCHTAGSASGPAPVGDRSRKTNQQRKAPESFLRATPCELRATPCPIDYCASAGVNRNERPAFAEAASGSQAWHRRGGCSNNWRNRSWASPGIEARYVGFGLIGDSRGKSWSPHQGVARTCPAGSAHRRTLIRTVRPGSAPPSGQRHRCRGTPAPAHHHPDLDVPPASPWRPPADP
jgi:hypothetical protein